MIAQMRILEKQILLSAFGVIIGAIISIVVAKHYYEKASLDLAVEAEKLKTMNVLMLRALEHAGLAEFSRDDDGNIRGFVFKFISEGGSMKSSGSAPTVFESAKKQ